MASTPAPLPSLGLLDGLGTAPTPAVDSPAPLPSLGLLGGLGTSSVAVDPIRRFDDGVPLAWFADIGWQAIFGHQQQGIPLANRDSTESLVIADASHAHAADNVVLTAGSVLSIADAAHDHAADNLTLTLDGATLAIDDALHGHAADSLTLTTSSTSLVIQDALHAHTADNVTIGGIAPTPPTSGGGYASSDRTKARLQAERRRAEQEEAELMEVAQMLTALLAAGVLD